ncbi:LegC family aminotransferase [Candidatus Sumerlaeota bacterium]|nr:LegC family aminotransferase [Candidatus Sumerlaeota bacterium]
MNTQPDSSAQNSCPEENKHIPLCVPEIRGNEWKYVKDCLDTSWVSSVGDYVNRFEDMLKQKAECDHAVATVNGTSALHIALLVAGVRPDDEVLVSNLTFIAPANAIRYAGAWPLFIDAEEQFWQMDVQQAVDFLEQGCEWKDGNLYNKVTDRRIGAVLPVHILGHPVEMQPLLEAARKFELPVIEDATESLGASYQGKMTGSLGDIACFSFNGNKLITTGGGGMITTSREDWSGKARYLTTQAKDDEVEYCHHEIGYNYRLTNVQAAMGCAQMELVDEYILAKHRIAERYRDGLSDLPGLTLMRQAEWAQSVWWMYTIQIDERQFGCGSRDLLKHLQQNNIQTRPLWQPMHLSPAHTQTSRLKYDVSEKLYREALSLPCSVGLSESDQQRVINEIHQACAR